MEDRGAFVLAGRRPEANLDLRARLPRQHGASGSIGCARIAAAFGELRRATKPDGHRQPRHADRSRTASPSGSRRDVPCSRWAGRLPHRHHSPLGSGAWGASTPLSLSSRRAVPCRAPRRTWSGVRQAHVFAHGRHQQSSTPAWLVGARPAGGRSAGDRAVIRSRRTPSRPLGPARFA